MSKGQTYTKIQRLLIVGGKNDPTTISFIRTKLVLKGIDPDKYGPDTDDLDHIIVILDKFTRSLIG
jgi:hypothetical protein